MATTILTENVYKSTGDIEGGVSSDKNDVGNYIGRDTKGTFIATRYGVTFDFWYDNIKGKEGSPSKEEQDALIKEFNSSFNKEEDAKNLFQEVYFTNPRKGNLNLGTIKDEATQSFILDSMVNQAFTFNNTSSDNIYEAIKAAGGTNNGDIVNDLNNIDQTKFRNEFLKVRTNRYSKSETFNDHAKGWMKRLDEIDNYWVDKGSDSGVDENFSFQDLVGNQTKGDYNLDLSTTASTNQVFSNYSNEPLIGEKFDSSLIKPNQASILGGPLKEKLKGFLELNKNLSGAELFKSILGDPKELERLEEGEKKLLESELKRLNAGDVEKQTDNILEKDNFVENSAGEFTKNKDNKMQYTDEEGVVTTFESLAEFQNFQKNLTNEKNNKLNSSNDVVDFGALNNNEIIELYNKSNEAGFDDVLKGALQSVSQGLIKTTLDSDGGFANIYNGIRGEKNLPDWETLTEFQKETFAYNLAKDNSKTGDFDTVAANEFMKKVDERRLAQKENDFKEGLLRNDAGQVVDTMGNIVNRDLSVRQDGTKVDLTYIPYEQTNMEDPETKDLKKVLTDSTTAINPFKDKNNINNDKIQFEDWEIEDDIEEDADDIGEILTDKKKDTKNKEKENTSDTPEGDSWLKKNAGALASGALGLLAGAQGVKSLRKSLEDIPIEESPKLDAAWQGYMAQMKEMAQSGLTSQEKASAYEELSSSYNLGVRNVMRASGGSRAMFLANAGVLNANRVKGLLKVSAADAAMQRDNLKNYGTAVKYQQEHGRMTGAIDQKMAYDEAARKSNLHGQVGNALIETALESVNYALGKASNKGFMDSYEAMFEQKGINQELKNTNKGLQTQLDTLQSNEEGDK